MLMINPNHDRKLDDLENDSSFTGTVEPWIDGGSLGRNLEEYLKEHPKGLSIPQPAEQGLIPRTMQPNYPLLSTQ